MRVERLGTRKSTRKRRGDAAKNQKQEQGGGAQDQPRRDHSMGGERDRRGEHGVRVYCYGDGALGVERTRTEVILLIAGAYQLGGNARR